MNMVAVIRSCMFYMFCSITPLPGQYNSMVYGQSVVQSLLGAGVEVNISRSHVSNVTCVHRVLVLVYSGAAEGEAQHGIWVFLCT